VRMQRGRYGPVCGAQGDASVPCVFVTGMQSFGANAAHPRFLQVQLVCLRAASAAPAEDTPQPPGSEPATPQPSTALATSAATGAALSPSISTPAGAGCWPRCALQPFQCRASTLQAFPSKRANGMTPWHRVRCRRPPAGVPGSVERLPECLGAVRSWPLCLCGDTHAEQPHRPCHQAEASAGRLIAVDQDGVARGLQAGRLT
jgi:hypothetical protein